MTRMQNEIRFIKNGNKLSLRLSQYDADNISIFKAPSFDISERETRALYEAMKEFYEGE